MVRDVNNDVFSSHTYFALDLIKFPLVLETIVFASVRELSRS